jgi:hypothetical protein
VGRDSTWLRYSSFNGAGASGSGWNFPPIHSLEVSDLALVDVLAGGPAATIEHRIDNWTFKVWPP